jgi:ABC-type sugar transport system permease subunit
MNKSWLTLRRKRSFLGVIFISPWLVGFIFMFAYPLVESLRFSFSKLVVGTSGFKLQSLGWKNFHEALYVHATFNRVLTESVMTMIINVPLILFFSLFSATLLNQRFFGRGIARALFFLPVILASGAIAAAELNGLIAQLGTAAATTDEPVTGAAGLMANFHLEDILLSSGMPITFVDYIVGAVNRIYSIISASGVQILIFLAALQSIPSSMYEVAKMEGATGYETFWKITFPMVSPLIITNVIYTIIDSFTDSPVTNIIYTTAFGGLDFGLSAAMAWLYTLAISLILLVMGALVSRKVFYNS